MSGKVELCGEWGVYDSCFDDAAEAAYQRQQMLAAEGWTELTITCEPDTAETWTYRLRGVAPAWEGVRNGRTIDGMTVHAVLARDGAAVAAKVIDLSANSSFRGVIHLDDAPGWNFYGSLNGVSAQYRDDEYPEAGAVFCPTIHWGDPGWGGNGLEYRAFVRYPADCCGYCGEPIANWVLGCCPVCGAG